MQKILPSLLGISFIYSLQAMYAIRAIKKIYLFFFFFACSEFLALVTTAYKKYSAE